jgi:hypothetical protein
LRNRSRRRAHPSLARESRRRLRRWLMVELRGLFHTRGYNNEQGEISLEREGAYKSGKKGRKREERRDVRGPEGFQSTRARVHSSCKFGTTFIPRQGGETKEYGQEKLVNIRFGVCRSTASTQGRRAYGVGIVAPIRAHEQALAQASGSVRNVARW